MKKIKRLFHLDGDLCGVFPYVLERMWKDVKFSLVSSCVISCFGQLLSCVIGTVGHKNRRPCFLTSQRYQGFPCLHYESIRKDSLVCLFCCWEFYRPSSFNFIFGPQSSCNIKHVSWTMNWTFYLCFDEVCLAAGITMVHGIQPTAEVIISSAADWMWCSKRLFLSFNRV